MGVFKGIPVPVTNLPPIGGGYPLLLSERRGGSTHTHSIGVRRDLRHTHQHRGADSMPLTHSDETTRNHVWAPYMVVNPGENMVEAAERHRRDTGHRGGVIIVGFNDGRRRLSS